MVIEIRIAGVDVLIDAPDGAAKVRELQQRLVEANEQIATQESKNVALVKQLRLPCAGCGSSSRSQP